MVKTISVSFKEGGKSYFFDANNGVYNIGDKVIVETKLGPELGVVRSRIREIDETKFKDKLKPVIRKATEKDIEHQNANEAKEREAMKICKEKIKEHKLKMNLVEAKYLFDNSKLIFYYTADKRVDFRDLVKDLAGIFKTRIELRQISSREQVRRVGGYGICGHELCCCSFLRSCEGATIKMAKEQNLTLNAPKITGSCGRLMCCLKYEQNVYEDKMKKLPHPGAIVKTPDGEGIIDTVEVLREVIKVKMKDDEGNNFFRRYPVEDVKIIKDTKKAITSETMEKSTKEEIKELENLEKLDKEEEKNSEDEE